MKVIKSKSLVKQYTSIALVGVIGISGLGAFGTSLSATKNASHVKVNSISQNQEMTIPQLQDAIQQKMPLLLIKLKFLLISILKNQSFCGEKLVLH